MHFPLWKQFVVLGICAVSVLLSLPNFFSADEYPASLPQNRVNLGLDLRGGSHLLLKLDLHAYMVEQYHNIRDELRGNFRKSKVGYRNLAAVKDGVTLQLRDANDVSDEALRELIDKINPDLEMLRKDDKVRIFFSERAQAEKRQQLLEQSIEIIGRRIDETGTKEPSIQRQGDDRVLLQVPGVDNPEQLKNIIGKTAKMTFHLVNENITPEQLARGFAPTGTRILSSERGQSESRVPVFSRVALSGELLTAANATFSSGQPVVEFTFDAVGARKFGEITQRNVGKRFAVVLDDKVITAPVIRSAILGGKGIIEGNFTVDSANELAVLLRAGALPAPLEIIEERSVGPSLGADSIAAGERAAAIACVAIMGFMVLYYGLFGIFANIALIMNVVMILSALSLFQATLTLPGIAGIVLTMGMAVDANTLIFERIREELRAGRSISSAIDHGFKAAFGTIFDANLTTIIAAALLFYFGTGSVKGFAVTLVIGILCSMFTAVSFTRLMITGWVNLARPQKLAL